MSDNCPQCGSANVSIANFRLVDYPSRTVYCHTCNRGFDEWPHSSLPRPSDTITIPRAQYEAYDMAAKALKGAYQIMGDLSHGLVEYIEADDALAALRAAGCLEDGE